MWVFINKIFQLKPLNTVLNKVINNLHYRHNNFIITKHLIKTLIIL